MMSHREIWTALELHWVTPTNQSNVSLTTISHISKLAEIWSTSFIVLNKRPVTTWPRYSSTYEAIPYLVQGQKSKKECSRLLQRQEHQYPVS